MSASTDENSKPADLSGTPFHKEDPSRVDLGVKVLEGIKIHGYRFTSKELDGGAVMGSIRGGTQSPVPDSGVTTFEIWYSPELKRILIQNVRQGNGDESDLRYEKITLSNPSPGKFLIPDGFQTVTTVAQLMSAE